MNKFYLMASAMKKKWGAVIVMGGGKLAGMIREGLSFTRGFGVRKESTPSTGNSENED